MKIKLKKIKNILLGIIILFLVLFISLNLDLLFNLSVFKSQNNFSMLSDVIVGFDGRKYILDKESNTEIIVIDENNKYLYTISSGGGDASFSSITSMCVDDKDCLYVVDVELDENLRFEKKKRILKFNNEGKFESVILEKNYDKEKRMINSTLLNLTYYDGKIYFIEKNKSKIDIYSIDIYNYQTKLEKSYYFKNPDFMLAQFTINPKNFDVYATSRDSNIYMFSGIDYKCIYKGGNFDENIGYFDIPYGIAFNYNSNRLYYSDIGTREVYELDLNTFDKTVIYERDDSQPLDTQEVIYKLSMVNGSEDGIIFPLKHNFLIYENNENVSYIDGYEFSVQIKIFYCLLIFALVILLILFIVFIVKIIQICFKEDTGILQTKIFMFIGIMILCFTITSIIISKTNNEYYEHTIKELSGFSQLVAEVIDGDILEKIDSPDDYMNEDYQYIRSQLQTAFDDNYIWCENTYAVIYRNYNNIVTYVFYLADENGFYPDDFEYEGSDYSYILKTGKQIIQGDYTTPEGSWMYVSTPIYNSKGDIVGVMEVGEDLYSYKEDTRKMLENLLVQIVPLTLIIFTIISELIYFFNDFMKKRDKDKFSKGVKNNKGVSISLVRSLAFVIYTADNFTSVLVPILSLRLFNKSLAIPEEIAIALPTCAYAFFLALSSFLSSQVVNKIGIRKMMFLGTIFHAGGLFLCGFYNVSIPIFALELSMVGIGMGMNLVAINMLIVNGNDSEKQNIGFSLLTTGTFAGTNTGLILGTNFATVISYESVFILSAIISSITILFVFIFIKNENIFSQKEEKEELHISKLVAFVFRPKVLFFLVLCAMPYIMFGSFIFYFIPLYAAEQGWSEALIGLLSLSYGLCASYLSPLLTKYILNAYGAKITLFICSLLTFIGAFLFVINPAVSMMIIITVFMGIADAIGYPSLSAYYVKVSEKENMDPEKAMGVYSLFDGIAQTIAPFVFSMALAIGMQAGILVISVGFIILISLFFITSLKK